MKLFYSAREGAEAAGLSVKHFRGWAKKLNLEPALFHNRTSKRRTHRYSHAQVQAIIANRALEPEITVGDKGLQVFHGHQRVEHVTQPRPAVPGMERVCLHCPHDQPSGKRICCQCNEPVEMMEYAYVSSLAQLA